MTDIALNIAILKEQIPSSVKLVAVSKTKPASDIRIAYDAGHRIFGENRVQELLAKKDLLPSDIEWHLIGHLQSNKVKTIIRFISMIQSVDSSRLLLIINNEAEKVSRKIDCLLQIYIAKEETKFGFSLEEVTGMLESGYFKNLQNVNVCGVMGMATFTGNMDIVRQEFRILKNCFDTLKEKYFKSTDHFKEISMGMSGDYITGIEEGSTMVRIGSLIFGDRKNELQ
jgi:pyridoxal phosphate enzyme (YggS family)